MGRNNRQRRAAKARARVNARRGGDGGGRTTAPGSSRPGSEGFSGSPRGGSPFGAPDDGFSPPDAAALAELLLREMATQRAFDTRPLSRSDRNRLDMLPVATVHRVAESLLLMRVSDMWAAGWQPGELIRHARLTESAPVRRLFEVAVATDHAGRRSTTLDHRWLDHVESLGLPVVNGKPGWVSRWVDDEGLARADALDLIADALACTLRLPALEPILAPPGSKGVDTIRDRGAASATGSDADPLLVRIRNLLAKAESTEFEAEAASFTAKAQELMTRHAIDVALVHGSGPSDSSDRPIRIRIPVDPPYIDAKSLLLQVVAEAGRCRSVLHSGLSMSTVVGFVDDVAGVELLFTSLLVQAQTALRDAARSAPAGTRTRSQSYRSAFLLSFAGRIGERLDEVNAAVYAEAEAEQGTSFLPVLADRSRAVDDAVEEAFGVLTSSRVRGGYDPMGWAGGRVAADNAKLAEAVTRR